MKYKTIWLLGLPSAGKTTIANKLKEELLKYDIKPNTIDGDEFRRVFCSDLGFTEEDRFDNIKRAREYCLRCNNHNIPVIASFITPYEEMREANRELLDGRYFEVWVNAPLKTCVERDVKGLYKKASKDEVKNMTGIDDDFDEPLSCDIVCYTDEESIEESVEKIMKEILE